MIITAILKKIVNLQSLNQTNIYAYNYSHYLSADQNFKKVAVWINESP